LPRTWIALLGMFLETGRVEYELFCGQARCMLAAASTDAYAWSWQGIGEYFAIVKPTLREETRGGWSPVMPFVRNAGRSIRRSSPLHPDRATVEFFVRA